MKKFLPIAVLSLLLAGCSDNSASVKPSTNLPSAPSSSTMPSPTKPGSMNPSTPSSSTTPSKPGSPSQSKPSTPSIVPEASIQDLLSSLQGNFTATGTIKDIDDNGVGSTMDFTTKFTDTTYHHDRTIDGESGSVDYFKLSEGGNDYMGSYSIDRENNLVLDKVDDGEGSGMSWSNVSNPFLDAEVDASYFTKDSTGNYYFDFSLDKDENGNRSKACRDILSKIPVLSFTKFAAFEMYVTGDRVSSFYIESKDYTDTNNNVFHYEIEFTVDTDQSHDHSAVIPSVYQSKSYTKSLKTAFNRLETGPYSFTRTVTGGKVTLPYLEGYNSDDVVYYQTEDSSNFNGYLVKDDYVHEIVKEDDTYYYDESNVSYDEEYLHNLNEFLPIRSVAVEAFAFDEESQSYVLNDDTLNFVYSFDGYLGLNQELLNEESVTNVSVKMSQSTISMLSYQIGSYTVTYQFTYDESKLPFDLANIEVNDSRKVFYGKYTGTLTGQNYKQQVKIVVQKVKNNDKYTSDKEPYRVNVLVSVDPVITDDSSVYTATDVSVSSDTLSFFCDYNYTMVYNKADGSYKLTAVSESGKTYTSVLTKAEA